MTATNALRLLRQAGIEPRTAEYAVVEDDFDGNHVADQIGLAREQVFKTLVARNAKRECFVFVVPVCAELDLKKAAKAAGEKSIAMIKQKDLLPLTGYVHGGCSPVGMKKVFPTFIHKTAEDKERIFVSAGKVGYQIELSPEDLMKAVRITPADLII